MDLPGIAVIGFLLSACVLLSSVNAVAQSNQPPLPFAGTDSVTLLNDSGTAERLGGTIEQIVGETLTLRRNGRGNIQVLRMEDVVELSFRRSAAWDRGLKLAEDGQLQPATVALSQALRQETRDWAWCELQATIAKLMIQMGNRAAAVERVEEILEKDDRSRHVSLLPLVWDERLPPEERLQADAADLGSALTVRRLVAASALLHDATHGAAAAAVLQRIRQQEGLSRLGELAGTQLWRLHLLEKPDERNALVQVWSERVRDLPIASRAGPQYVVARNLQQQHKYDKAALAFLWTPLMNTTDQALAAQSLVSAIDCLQQAGRRAEAKVMAAELTARFPNASATAEFKSRSKSPDEE